ncbi:MAG: FAD-binding oxidoreductase [Gammaproteobacteria bacterium]|nr:FAD-binding oxidoreductase [Gammaproteobacteria bacterium]MBL6998352.1 FAD-binding oxidoreductase [Gammaproteobacteria bacterium]
MPAESLQQFIAELKQSGFSGDIESTYAQRTVAATDNSIYHQMPLAILYPALESDIHLAVACVYRHRSEGFSLCARGGGTGTNGQSLTNNLILDCGRHLNRILHFDAEKRTVTLQPGVVLDQLNAFLKPHGLFFPIDISSSSRATLGGMVATDASGKGSLIYGKTSHHIQSLELVLADARDFHAQALNLQQLDEDALLKPVYQQIEQQRDEIDRVFPIMDRGLTGYNLQHSIATQNQFDPCFLISGSEGTLAITRQITLRVIPRPTHKILTVIFYSDFQRALEHIQPLLKSRPAAIEMLDDKVLQRARNDAVWFDVQSVLSELSAHSDIRAANFVEHVGHSEQQMLQAQQAIQSILQQSAASYAVILSNTETDPAKISALWNLRKRAVGLLGQAQQGKRGIAFVEDTAVPPQNMVAYVTDFRRLLDQHQLEYGMYGHADAGLLHVRPVLNMLQAEDRALIRTISDQVAQLAKRHGGVLWGEHGRGYRGEYTPLFFGEILYPLLCKIKKHFDPYNLLNPGKLVTPAPEQPLIALDSITLRGALDQHISSADQQQYASSLACNGNGACFNWQPEDAMCPSYRATRNKLYSPKGRAALQREWLRLKNSDTATPLLDALEQSLFDSLQYCLSCKSCSSSCPLKVDIPELKSRFLQSWYQRHRRPATAFFIRYFESLISTASRLPRLSNWLLTRSAGSKLLQHVSGLGRLPKFSTGHYQNASMLRATQLKPLKSDQPAVILMRDNYLHSFERASLQACCNILHRLGVKVYLSPLIRNAKLLHVKGYRKQFGEQAANVCEQLQQLASLGLPLLSIETVTRLMADMEYAEILQRKSSFHIQSIESYLSLLLRDKSELPALAQTVTLLPHCMEQTHARQSALEWQTVFRQMGIKLQVKNAGCCGMSGLFGHEVEHHQLSDRIFQLAWEPALQAGNSVFLASGFSCRCQTHYHQFDTQHPLVYLDQLLQSALPSSSHPNAQTPGF